MEDSELALGQVECETRIFSALEAGHTTAIFTISGATVVLVLALNAASAQVAHASRSVGRTFFL